MDDANQNHLVEGDVVMCYPPLPVRVVDVETNAFAVLNTVEFPSSQPTLGQKLTAKNWRTRLATCLTNLSRVTGFFAGV